MILLAVSCFVSFIAVQVLNNVKTCCEIQRRVVRLCYAKSASSHWNYCGTVSEFLTGKDCVFHPLSSKIFFLLCSNINIWCYRWSLLFVLVGVSACSIGLMTCVNHGTSLQVRDSFRIVFPSAWSSWCLGITIIKIFSFRNKKLFLTLSGKKVSCGK